MDVNARRHANPDGICDAVCTVWWEQQMSKAEYEAYVQARQQLQE